MVMFMGYWGLRLEHAFWGPQFNPLQMVIPDRRVLTVRGQEDGLLRPFPGTRLKEKIRQTTEGWDMNLYVHIPRVQSISLATH